MPHQQRRYRLDECGMLTPIDTMRRIVETNVLGTFLLCQEAARLMQKNAGGAL